MCKVIAVTNRRLCQGDFLDRIRLLCHAGLDQIILREKDLPQAEYEKLAERVLEVCQNTSVLCLLHQHIETAKKLRCFQIHLPVPELLAHQEAIENFARVGTSVHSLEQLEIAEKCHADYVLFGHVFPTDCKKGMPARGTQALQDICQRATIPVYAIGGIAPENASKAIEAGACGVCVMSWGMQAEEKQIEEFVRQCHEKKV